METAPQGVAKFDNVVQWSSAGQSIGYEVSAAIEIGMQVVDL